MPVTMPVTMPNVIEGVVGPGSPRSNRRGPVARRFDRGRSRPPALFDRSEVPGFDAGGRRGTTMADDRARATAPAGGRGDREVAGAAPTGPRPRPAPPIAPVAPAARGLLADASLGLGRACSAGDPADRYAIAHLAALRGAAAVLAARARPTRGRQGSVWTLMTRVAPEFAEWAAFFAAGSAKRQAVQAGLPAGVTAREADDLVRQVALFLSLVGESIEPAAGR